MQISFYILLFIFVFLCLLKIVFTILYIKQNKLTTKDFDETKFSIVQPIMSGDKMLESNLRYNLEHTRNMHFIWLLDGDDTEAKRITQKIVDENKNFKNRVKIISVDNIPNNCNRKTYKMKFALEYAKEYFIALDDDTLITYEKISQAVDTLMKFGENTAVTAYPYHRIRNEFYSSLVSAFVNANSLFLYLGASYVNSLKMLSGMFYIIKTEYLKNTDAFNKILYNLSDELALGELLIENGMTLKMLPIPCPATTTVYSLRHYMNLMKRWIVFFNHYMKEDLSPKVIILGLFPAMLPVLLLIISAILGIKYFVLFICIHLLKSIVNRFVRRKILGIKEKFSAIIFEILADYLQVIHIANAFLFPHSIVWRNKNIILKNNTIFVKE